MLGKCIGDDNTEPKKRKRESRLEKGSSEMTRYGMSQLSLFSTIKIKITPEKIAEVSNTVFKEMVVDNTTLPEIVKNTYEQFNKNVDESFIAGWNLGRLLTLNNLAAVIHVLAKIEGDTAKSRDVLYALAKCTAISASMAGLNNETISGEINEWEKHRTKDATMTQSIIKTAKIMASQFTKDTCIDDEDSGEYSPPEKKYKPEEHVEFR